MQSQKEITRINVFVTVVLPIVVNVTKRIRQALNFQVIKKCHGLDLVFTIKNGEKKRTFFEKNMKNQFFFLNYMSNWTYSVYSYLRR
jgi:hypothetical protein